MTDYISTYQFFDNSLWSLLLQVFVVIYATSIIAYLVRSTGRRILKKTQRTATWWDDAMVSAAEAPSRAAIWIAGVALAVDIIYEHAPAAIFQAINPIRDLGLIASLAWFLLRLARQAEKRYLETESAVSNKADPATVSAIAKLVRLSIGITTALVALQTLGFSISGVLAFGGIGGIAVGFASRDLLANFFGSLIIYFDRPFREGDWIRSPDKDIEGTVELIGWRVTRIRKFDRRPIYVPNGLFSSITIENPSRMTHRRIYEVIGIRYADAAVLESIVVAVRDMLSKHSDIDTDDLIMVNFSQFSASSIDFFIYAFARTTVWAEYNEIKSNILIRINNIISEHGAEIAYPTQTLHIPELLARDAHSVGNQA